MNVAPAPMPGLSAVADDRVAVGSVVRGDGAFLDLAAGALPQLDDVGQEGVRRVG
jgi:hypothetical protein